MMTHMRDHITWYHFTPDQQWHHPFLDSNSFKIPLNRVWECIYLVKANFRFNFRFQLPVNYQIIRYHITTNKHNFTSHTNVLLIYFGIGKFFLSGILNDKQLLISYDSSKICLNNHFFHKSRQNIFELII